MLQGRLTLVPAALAATVLLTACASVDGTESGAIREAVIEPGITAIEQSGALACNADASTLRTALDVYEIREGSPAPDEASLVAEQYIREESELWDIREGVLVPQDPGCGSVPATVPTEEIVTDDRPATDDELSEFADELATMTADDILADATEDEIAEVGGLDCAREIAEVGLAFARWSTDQNAEPTSLHQLVDDGYLGRLELWTVASTSLEAVPGTRCVGPFEVLPTFDDACRVEARTLETAREAYLARAPDAPEPTQQDLVDAGLLRSVSARVDLADGLVVPITGGVCESIDLSSAGAPPPDADCDTEYRTLAVAIEAFFIEFDRTPDNERQLIDGGMIRASSPNFDVVYGEIVPGDGSSCTVPPE